jgi:hypothetical protein
MGVKYSLKNGIFADMKLKNTFFIIIIISIILIVGFFIGIVPANRGILTSRIVLILDDVGKIILIILYGSYNVILIIICLLRIKKIKYFFQYGLETDAKIIETMYRNNEQGIVYIYKIDGIQYKITIYYEELINKIFPKFKYVISNYRKGEIIVILVDPKNHKKFLLKDQYLDRRTVE